MLIEEKIRRRQRQKQEELDIIDKYEEETEGFNTKQSKALGEFI